jgi:membrane dipeptidase
MGRNKKYEGYNAYDYLEPGTDFRQFKLRNSAVEEWSYTVPLSASEEERFDDIIEKNILVDLHEHPCLYPEDIKESPELFHHGRQFMAYEALSLSGLDCVFDNLMDGRCYINTKHGWDWLGTIHDLGVRLCDIAHQKYVIHCKEVNDIKYAFETGKLAWVPVIESSSCIENEVDRIDVLYGLGVRSMGICYSESNMLGSGLNERKDGGLTDFGFDAVVRMNKVGMLIDVSHTGDLTAIETINASGTPIIISHAGTRTLMPTRRMFPDEVLQPLAENKGVLGLEVAGFGLRTDQHPKDGIEAYMEHMEFCIELMGINHVGCGPDSLYGDHVGHYKAFHERNLKNGWGHNLRTGKESEREYPAIKYVKGMENPTECLLNVTRWLIKNGYSDEEIVKIVGGNALRLLEKVWK